MLEESVLGWAAARGGTSWEGFVGGSGVCQLLEDGLEKHASIIAEVLNVCPHGLPNHKHLVRTFETAWKAYAHIALLGAWILLTLGILVGISWVIGNPKGPWASKGPTGSPRATHGPWDS